MAAAHRTRRSSSIKEPFPLLNVETLDMATTTSSCAPNGTAVHRSSWASEANGSLATSLAHMSGIDVNKKHDNAPREKRLSKRRKARSLVRRIKLYASRHTWAFPLAMIMGILSGYAVYPNAANPLAHFVFLSYRMPQTDLDSPVQYGKGVWDIAFVVFYTIVLTFTREFFMQEVFRPLSRVAGLHSRAKQTRFMEQMYSSLYFGVLGPAGLYVMSRTPVWFYNTRGMYENFPHKTHEAIVKFYYLFQAAYWAQQAIVLVLGMEKPRKDFKELVGHHIVSLSLIGLSYRFHFTYIGLAIYTTHDISDFFLATSKSLNYIDGPFMGLYYFIFMCAWVYLRHYLNLRVIYSLFTEFKTVGPYELNWETEQYKCPLSFVITTGLLSALQALNIFWLFFIIRIAYRFVVRGVAKDDRSDVEEDTDVEEPTEKQALLVDGAAQKR